MLFFFQVKQFFGWQSKIKVEAISVKQAIAAAKEQVDIVSLNFIEDHSPNNLKLDLVAKTAKTIKDNFDSVLVEVVLIRLDPTDFKTISSLAITWIDIISVRELVRDYVPIDFLLKSEAVNHYE